MPWKNIKQTLQEYQSKFPEFTYRIFKTTDGYQMIPYTINKNSEKRNDFFKIFQRKCLHRRTTADAVVFSREHIKEVGWDRTPLSRFSHFRAIIQDWNRNRIISLVTFLVRSFSFPPRLSFKWCSVVRTSHDDSIN